MCLIRTWNPCDITIRWAARRDINAVMPAAGLFQDGYVLIWG